MKRPMPLMALTLTLCSLAAAVAVAEPIGSLHCNDSTGVTRANGRSITIVGTVSAQFSTTKNSRFYVQDATGGVCVFGVPQVCLAAGDSVRVSGDVASFNGLTQVTGSTESPLVIEKLGRSHAEVVAAAATPTSIRATLQPDGCEPNEGRLVLVHDVYVRSGSGAPLGPDAKFADGRNYRLMHAAADSASDWVMMRVGTSSACDSSRTLNGVAVPVTPVQVIGILSQFLSREATTGGYQVLPRTKADVQLSAGDSPEPRNPTAR
jgi:hypothetical protein